MRHIYISKVRKYNEVCGMFYGASLIVLILAVAVALRYHSDHIDALVGLGIFLPFQGNVALLLVQV